MEHRSDWLEPLRQHSIRGAFLALDLAAPCHLVGGILRDLWVFGRIGSDWDIVLVDAQPAAERLARRLGGKVLQLGGDRFDLYRIIAGSTQIDLQEPLQGGLEAELERRDLTINSIAFDVTTGEIYDPLGGSRDLAGRILRTNGATGFSDDPLRILRLLRFAVTLPRFEIERRTLDLARGSAEKLTEVAPERVREELLKIMSGTHATHLGTLLAAVGIFPDLWCATGADTDSMVLDAPSTRELDEALGVVERSAGYSAGGRQLEALRHAAFLSVAAGPSRVTSRHLLERGFISRDLARRIDRIVASEGSTPNGTRARGKGPPEDEPSRRRWIHRHGEIWPLVNSLEIWLADGRTREAWQRASVDLARTAANAGAKLLDPPPLLDGNHLQMEFSIEPGPRLGRLLAAIEAAQIEGTITTPEEARDWLRRKLREESPI